ncbi:LuxR C-terminal-related transcriptional regulator [Dyadobacter alkalitolerans]|uniref:LuxR C-terminal-related transcriptional regulator n=1 Tax=Dyadobacter alkalitolerans TaxID=492736 RepID=UPI00047DA392|nr:LuxR C-terminal-related transcriptional regulator [Dyadobacter alkalitolerans]
MTILIVTDNHLFSLAIRTIINNQYPDAVIIETPIVQDAIGVSYGTTFQVMILDVSAADAKDTALLLNYKKANPHTAVLVHLGDQTQLMYKFIRAGVTALFSNKSSPAEINEGLRRAESNTRFISADIQEHLLFYITEKPINHTLTKREEIMADLLVAKNSYEQIAVIAGTTSKSVGYYKRKIFEKLEVDNIVDLAIKLNKVVINKEKK